MDSILGITLSNCFCFPSEKGSSVRNNFLPVGANSFNLEETSFRKGLDLLESKHDVTKIVVFFFGLFFF